MLKVYAYDAGQGDCLHIRFFGKCGTYHNILVDSGTSRFGRDFIKLCCDIRHAGEHIDVLFITHTDADHLGGLLYAVNHKIIIQVDKIIINHPKTLPTHSNIHTPLSASQANAIVNCLADLNTHITHGLQGDTIELDGALIQILNPAQEQVETVFPAFVQNTPLGTIDDRNVSLEELMERPLPGGDTSISNRVSIVFVLEYEGKRLLFTGDAWSCDLLKGIQNYAAVRKEKTFPIHFDMVKLPHHGSARNLSEEWPQVLWGKSYILCADGRRHPSKQTIAKLLHWYGTIEIVSSRAWWNSGYFSVQEKEKFVRSNKLCLILSKEEGKVSDG